MLWTVTAAALLTEGYLSCGCQQPCFPLVLKEGWRAGPRGSCWHFFCCGPTTLLCLATLWVPTFAFLQQGGCSPWALGCLGVKAGAGQLHPIHSAVPRTCSSQVLRRTCQAAQLWGLGHSELLSPHSCWCSCRAPGPFCSQDMLLRACIGIGILPQP